MIFSDICSCSAVKHAPEYTLSCSVLHSCQGGSSYTSNQGGGRTLLRSRKQGCNHLFIHSSVYSRFIHQFIISFILLLVLLFVLPSVYVLLLFIHPYYVILKFMCFLFSYKIVNLKNSTSILAFDTKIH